MSSINSSNGKTLRPYSYDNFQGLDTSRDIASQDTGENQHLAVLKNGFASFRGIIIRDPALSPRTSSPGDRIIKHIQFFGRNLLAWAQEDGGGITLVAEPNGITKQEIFPSKSIVTSTVYNNRLIFFCQGHTPQVFDGLTFSNFKNNREKPAFGVAIQGRLAIAGGIDRKTIIDFSQLNNEEKFSRDELPTETAVTKGADIDIKNIIGTADEITGLGVFEQARLAVFTNDQTIVYNISPDFTRFQIDDKASIGIGCVSHNSIANVGTDVIFCSRSGVHSLRRSESNGITIYTIPLSSKIEELYKNLIRKVSNLKDISAMYDRDRGQYHIFFPINDGMSQRLTLSMSPSPDSPNKWSTSDHLFQRCGASSGGFTCVGTSGGIFNVLEYEDTNATNIPEMEIITPILWHGSITDTKHSNEFIIQASGQGRIEIDAFNNEGDFLSTIKVDLDVEDNRDDEYVFVPLFEQYNRQFVHQYKGVQFRIRTIGGQGRIKIIGFAVMVEQEPRRRR